jgi:hypothetical protein
LELFKAEKNFSTLQEERRRLNLQLIEAQQKLRQIRDEMDRLNRTDSSYLKLFTEEHGLLKLESRLVSDYKLKEEEERAAFFHLSSALRDAQQKERIRVERMKYLQLGLSILCTSLGLLSAYLLNYFRNSNIREILEYDKEHFKALEDSVKTIIEKQEGLGTNFETMITKWNKSFKPPDGSQTVEQIAQTNSIPISIVEASEDDDSEQARSLNKYYANAALLSVILLIPMFYYFKNK